MLRRFHWLIDWLMLRWAPRMYAIGELFCKMLFTRRKQNLFAFWWNTGLSLHCLSFHICFRVDPTAKVDGRRNNPVEMAASRNSTQVLDILSEHADISATLKLVQLSELMRSSDTLTKDEFQGILHSLPVDLVSSAYSVFVCFNCTHNFNQTQSASLHISTIFQWDIQVSSADVCGCGTLLQDAIRKNKQHFVRLLLEFGL